MLTRRDFSKCLLAGGTASVLADELRPAGKLVPANQSANLMCDLLIKGGTVIDPGQQLNGRLDVAVKDSKVLAVARDIPEAGARRVVSAKDKIVTPGLIDIHVHCFDGISFGANADRTCLSKGVTTVVDAGSVGYPMIDGFVKYVVKASITRICALVDISALGITVGIKDTMKNLDWVNPQLTAKAAEDNKPSVVGIKVRLQQMVQGDKDLECLKRALEAAEATRLPLMVHIDDPYSPLPDILKMLRKGDIFTHVFNGHAHGVLDAQGKILPEVWDARQRGVIMDPAEGSHLNFDVAEKCLAQKFLPDTISTDLVSLSAFGPTYDLPTEMSKYLALGMTLDQVIERVTASPARVFDYGLPLGTLKPGSVADIAISEIHEGQVEFLDSDQKKRTGRQRLVSQAVIRGGQYFLNAG